MGASAEPQLQSAPACPICGSDTRFTVGLRGYRIMECATCTHRFADYHADSGHVGRVYNDTYFTDGGAGYQDYTLSRAELFAQGRFYGRLLARYSQLGDLLDVGAAAGFVLDGMRSVGWTPHGLEPNERMAHYAAGHLNLPVHIGTLEAYDTRRRFKVVSLIQVLAHFVDPVPAITKAIELTEPAGLLLVETWDCRSLFARLCGSRWHEYSPPSVLHYFSRDSLVRCMNDRGLDLVSTGRRHKPLRMDHAHTLAEHVYGPNSLVSTALGMLPGQLSVPYLPDDLFWSIWRRRGSVH